jgi:hypothetical protein
MLQNKIRKKGYIMLKVLTTEIKELATWEEALDWLSRHGRGSAQIAEQKLLWDEFKKSGTDSAEIIYDSATATMLLVKEVPVAPVAPVKADK